MSIWEYADDPDAIAKAVFGTRGCLFCKSSLLLARRADLEPRPGMLEGDDTVVQLCPRCGWWIGQRRVKHRTDIIESTESTYGSYGVLKNLDCTDISVPIAEIRDYLTLRYEQRHHIHPRLFEETVASIFADIGYGVELTAYSGDGGIDVILTNSGSRVGVQVKRYRGAIEADQIRAFLGALVIGDYTRGAYVTTSRFRAGARKAAQASAIRGHPIELIDAEKLYEVLEIAQGKVERSPEEWLEIVHPRLKLLEVYTHVEAYYAH